MTHIRPSRAMCCMVATQPSPVANVGATQISTPWEYWWKRASGMWFSQQISPPMRPRAVGRRPGSSRPPSPRRSVPGAGRHQLAVLVQEPPIGSEVEQRVL